MADFLAVDEFDHTNVSCDGAAHPADVMVEIKDGSFGWSKDTPLLKNINIQVKEGDLVVIHGLVGSGKSSLCSALLGEMDKLSGSVFVRGRVAYYSQQTWIQNMTIRENILFGKAYDEKKYQQVLDACGLLPDLAQFPAEGSFVARAMLTKSRIVVMDEATASIDHATEKKLQHMINRDFKDATVLTIAHRLATVLDSDRIMVLSDGKVVEFDTPHNLVENEGGVFYELAKEGGFLEKFQAK
ncbi:hypothetical protein Poli38472_012133 [Pythium oligandrum]|uniref:ABC transporter domain-containing protein n=1 Tax=Pythium oligandrum TaxID=41045 RepID=A0A8K1CQX0_PYTOL|nr:hypothetical protein Poli38472_012133 [Pythium oligandrum]|eukprot:TMW67017.1 hypothetical protein Poli38472_012133 [Pythium oligandrum]